ncbi:hypothetical protein CFC21_005313 [Triticum aestivum]|uniref:VAN3-binding protein-like auxin canalisation domain-containing protein n=2 Tax=Triticum aestivum TaxID=4565 RepID=A0A9R1IP98_WHEAT|nr:hypothetical protein CFC21_005313 [Triticum aestivum]
MGIHLMEDMDTLLKVTRHQGSPTLLPGRILLHRNMGTLSRVATHLTVDIPPSATLATGVATEAMAMAAGTWATEAAMAAAAMLSGTTMEATATAIMVTEAMATGTTVPDTTTAGTAGGTMAMDITTTTTTASTVTASSRSASDLRLHTVIAPHQLS